MIIRQSPMGFIMNHSKREPIYAPMIVTAPPISSTSSPDLLFTYSLPRMITPFTYPSANSCRTPMIALQMRTLL
jgi:hypothetical protein